MSFKHSNRCKIVFDNLMLIFCGKYGIDAYIKSCIKYQFASWRRPGFALIGACVLIRMNTISSMAAEWTLREPLEPSLNLPLMGMKSQ